METNGNGRRGPRHVAAPPRATRLAETIRKQMAAEAARLIYPNPKKAAARVNRSVRTIQRWRNEEAAQGSPVYQAIEAMEASENPAEAEAIFRAVQLWRYAKLAERDLDELKATYHELREEDAVVEGEDNGNKVKRGIGWMARFSANNRDAQVDLWLAAFALEFARRDVPEDEVLLYRGRVA